MSDPHDPSAPRPGFKVLDHEEEHRGSIWKHPYMIYIVLTLVIFGFLMFIGWFALTSGWIPTRRIS